MHCPHHAAARCRSCTRLGQPYADQLADKQRHCRALLSSFQGLKWLPPVGSREAGFRNKAKMVVGGSVQQPVLGILGTDGQGVDLRDCALYSPRLQASFDVLAEFVRRAKLTPYDVPARRGELKYLLVTESADGELMLRFVLRSEEAMGRLRGQFRELMAELPALKVVSVNFQPEHKAVLEGEHEVVLSDQDTLPMPVNGLKLHLRPQSFFQTNTGVAAALYRQAREWVDEIAPASIWDLYCGAGGFALHCAGPWREVTGIELSAEAVASAERSRDEAGLRRVRFQAGDATAFAKTAEKAPELAIVNPPRRGIGVELAQWLEASSVQQVIYSSCNAESLARDLKAMPSLKPTQARLLDMFPQTDHYEVILLLERGVS
jgi:23S rRNA (uracil747-C5)-methyltransferase